MNCHVLLPMASRFERCCFSLWSEWKGDQGFLGTGKFHLMQGVLSHMAGKEVGREGETMPLICKLLQKKINYG